MEYGRPKLNISDVLKDLPEQRATLKKQIEALLKEYKLLIALEKALESDEVLDLDVTILNDDSNAEAKNGKRKRR